MLSALMETAAFLAAPESPARSREVAELRPLVRAVVSCVLREPLDHADVEDCTSEAMRRALEGKSTERGPLRPWVLGIARHVALDTLRARQRQRARTVDVPDDAPSSTRMVMDRLIDPSAGADEQMEEAERAARVRRVLETLPEGPRRALSLFHLEGLSYQEIGARLEVPLGTVATWVTRGRKAMADALDAEISRGRRQ
ncbi:MAG: sigma-70 family RNA polymerase sigma factor [Deltaproteobacteria bacterium]|nr:sigma-70 family RNA polymerase sigma factor [Deltaproteobacteria bacterium]